MTFSKPVGIWIRVSTEDQAKGESPEHHEKRARFYSESKGWEVKDEFKVDKRDHSFDEVRGISDTFQL
jgi:site-specific DNA recombinase